MTALLKRNHLCVYSLLFLIVLISMLAYLYVKGLSLVNIGDGLAQHYPAFLYMGPWWRDTIASLVSWSPPRMWDFAIGYGSDILQTLTYYCLFDITTVPFALFANESNGPFLYTAMVVCKSYLAGLSFVFLCRRLGCAVWGAAIAAFAYIFCPYLLDTFWRNHHFFVLPLIYMPLFLLCAERIIDGKKSLLFVSVICFSALSSYYYLYMELSLTALYIFCRCMGAGIRSSIQRTIKAMLLLALHAIVGIMLAMPVLLPQIAHLTTDVRMSAGGSIDAFYSIDQYLCAIGGFVSSNTFSYYSYLGVTPCVWIAVVLLYVQKDENSNLRWLKLLLAITIISFFIPIMGYVMNGFSYVANRHSWFLALLASLTFALMWDKLLSCSQDDVRKVLVATILYSILVIFTDQSRSRESVIGIGLLIITSLVLMISGRYALREVMGATVLSIMLVAGIALQIYNVYIVQGALAWLIRFDDVPIIYRNSYESLYEEADSSTLWRLDYATGKRRPNTLNNKSGEGSTYSYWSFQNPYIAKYLDSNGLLVNNAYEFQGLADRRGLQVLLGSKYVVQSNDETNISMLDDSLPIAYIYRSALSTRDYYSSTYGQRQMAQSLGCVVSDDGLISRFHAEYPKASTLTYKFAPTSVNQVADGEIIIRDTNEPLVITTSSWPALRFDDELLLEFYSLQFFGDPHKDAAITVQTGDKTETQQYLSSYNRYYFGKRDFVFNLRRNVSSEDAIRVIFSEPGTYRYSSMLLERVPIATSGASYDSVSNINVKRNSVSCDVSTADDGLLFFSIPYSNGWHAYVNGEEREMYAGNIMGIAIVVGAGDDQVELRYETPCLREGVVCCIVGLALVVVMLVRSERCAHIDLSKP